MRKFYVETAMNPSDPTTPRKMTTTEYLQSKGWRLVRIVKQRGDYLKWEAWEHPEHQHDRRGFFQKTEAIAHQREIDKGLGCDCIKQEENVNHG